MNRRHLLKSFVAAAFATATAALCSSTAKATARKPKVKANGQSGLIPISTIPIGYVFAYSGLIIPKGWEECDAKMLGNANLQGPPLPAYNPYSEVVPVRWIMKVA
jgi:hypothetical protein